MKTKTLRKNKVNVITLGCAKNTFDSEVMMAQLKANKFDMKCKDIPTIPILEFLYDRKKHNKIWCCWYDGFENSIGQAMPPNTPEKIIIQKMAKLIKRKLVSGCGCGCRGDYEITNKGIDFLSNK
jgi:hypothetical protein